MCLANSPQCGTQVWVCWAGLRTGWVTSHKYPVVRTRCSFIFFCFCFIVLFDF